jgi:riboflavin kinase/FMN adenylyltransferase
VRIIKHPAEIQPLGPGRLSATIGNFDGLHLGHQAVISELVESATSRAGTSLAVTFDPHPVAVVEPSRAPALLTPTDEKAELFASTGVDALLVVAFTREVADEEAYEFISWLGVGRGSHLVLGYDFHMGRGRHCDLARLSRLGAEMAYGIDVIPPVENQGLPISSTRIRERIAAGAVEEAAEMLGRPYRLSGRVVGGQETGRLLASPTANLELPPDKLLPGDGVYFARVSSLGGRAGVLYVGARPTFGGGPRRAEVHVLDADLDLYGQVVSVDVLRRLRGDATFKDPADLRRQIGEDIARAREMAVDGGAYHKMDPLSGPDGVSRP